MLQPENISQVLNEKIALLRSKNVHKGPPSFTPMYADSVALHEQVKVHALHGVFPEKLFREKAPNESPQEFEYRKNLYHALGGITRPYWSKALAQLNRVWNEKNYYIKYPEIQSDIYNNYPAFDYFNRQYPGYQSIETFFRSVVTPAKINDPNGLLVVRPHCFEMEQNEPAAPVAILFSCDEIYGYKENEYALLLTDEKSPVEYGGNTVKEGLMLHLYDDTAIYEIRQIGKKTDFEFAINELYRHELGLLPCFKLKGYPVEKAGEILYESYFMPAVPCLNDALCDSSTLRMSKFAHAFLQRWEYVDDCNAPGCEAGYMFSDDRLKKSRCTTCHGSGKRSYLSPLSVLQIQTPRQSIPGEDTKDMTIPPAGYVPLDHSILDFLSAEVDKHIRQAFEMLNLDITNSNVKGSETATGKAIDREALFSFLLMISNELFELLENTVNTIGRMRYGQYWQPVQLTYPQNFSIRSDYDLSLEIAEAKKNNMPDIAQRMLLLQYANTRFNGGEETERYFKLIFGVDRLISFSPEEIAQKINLGIVQKWEAVLHDSIQQFIDVQCRQNPEFFTLDFLIQKEQLEEMAKAKTAEMLVNTPTPPAEEPAPSPAEPTKEPVQKV